MMIAMQVPRPGGTFERVQRKVPTPAADELLIRVHACGVCHSDAVTVEGLLPGLQYPRVPGHEVIGSVEAVGANVRGWTVGDRAGVGWFGGSCGHCRRCRGRDVDLLSAPDGNYIEPAGTTRDLSNIPMMPQNSS
jgi:alcohol dehydrogenase